MAPLALPMLLALLYIIALAVAWKIAHALVAMQVWRLEAGGRIL